MSRSMHSRILGSDIIRTALSLAWPVMLSNAFQTVYNLTDALWLGRLGPEALAAPSISWPIIFLFISMSAGLGIGGLTLIAQYTGAGEKEETNHVAGQLLFILLSASTLVAIIGFVFADSVLHLLNIPENVFDETSSYLRISFLGLPFLFMHFGFQALLRGYGDTRTPMLLSVTSALGDMILDPFFVFGLMGLPVMGSDGAALTTVLTRGASGVTGLYLLTSGRVGITVKPRHLAPNPAMIRKILSIGLPSSVGQIGTALGFTVLTSLVAVEDASLGGEGLLLSAYGIGNRVSSIVNIIIFGGVNAVSTMVGQNLGAGQPQRAGSIVKKLFLTFTVISTLESLIVFILRAPIYHVFINDTDVVALGSTYIAFFIPSIPFFALFRLALSVFEAAGMTKKSMTLSLIRLWGMRTLLAYVLYFLAGMGASGIWLGLTLGNVGAALLSIVWLSKTDWRRKIV